MLRVARFTAKLGFRSSQDLFDPRPPTSSTTPAARLLTRCSLLLSGHAMACPGAAPRGPAPRPAADARPDPRAARRRALRHGGAGGHRRAGARRQDDVAGVPVRLAVVAAGAHALAGRRRARRALHPGAVGRDRFGARRAGRTDRDPAPLHRRHARDLDDAGALRTSHGPLAAYAGCAPPVPRRLRFLQLRCQSGEAPAELGDWWSAFAAADTDDARRCWRVRRSPVGGAAKKRRRRSGSRRGGPREGAADGRPPNRGQDGNAGRGAGAAAEPKPRREHRDAPGSASAPTRRRRRVDRAGTRCHRLAGRDTIERVSSLYRSEPVEAQGPTSNAVAEVETTRRRGAARAAARDRRPPRAPAPWRNAPHTRPRPAARVRRDGPLRVDSPSLTLPHPRMHLRAFVLAPLAELDAGLVVPGRGRVADLLAGCAGQRIERVGALPRRAPAGAAR